MSKYIDLEDQISDYYDTAPGLARRAGICDALRYLDSHPDQVPGRTLTRTEYRDTLDHAVKISGHGDDWERGFCTGLTVGGTRVVPDPEPTNAGHDRDWWVDNANVNDAEDCEACEGELCPVHYGISMGIDLMAKKIAALGDDPELFALIPDPVKAPGGDDE